MANYRLQNETTLEAGGVEMPLLYAGVVLISQLSKGFPDLNVLNGGKMEGHEIKGGFWTCLGHYLPELRYGLSFSTFLQPHARNKTISFQSSIQLGS